MTVEMKSFHMNSYFWISEGAGGIDGQLFFEFGDEAEDSVSPIESWEF